MSFVNVQDTASLQAALSVAQAGETILLAPGLYSGLNISNLNFASNVTITSASTSNEATLSAFNVKNSSGLTFSNLVLDESNSSYTANNIVGDSNIAFTGLTVHGALGTNPISSTINSFLIQNCLNVTITNSEFYNLQYAVQSLNDTGLNYSKNFVHDMRTDGFDFSADTNVSVTQNMFTDFYSAPLDHSDAIQFWTNGSTTSSSSIDISNNIFVRGQGVAIQGVFMRDEIGNLPYNNVNITNNTLVGTLWNGITVYHANGLQISNNKVWSIGSTYGAWILADSATNASLLSNSAGSYQLTNDANITGWSNGFNTPVSDAGYALAETWFAANPGTLLLKNFANLLGFPAPNAIYSGTAADVSANLASLNNANTIASVVISDNAPLQLSVSQWTSDTHLLGELTTQCGKPYQLNFSDNAVNLAAALNALNSDSHVHAIVVSDNAPLTLTAAQATGDATALGLLVNANGSAPVINVTDTAANLSGALGTLGYLPHLSQITIADSAALTLSAGQFAADTAGLAKIVGAHTVDVSGFTVGFTSEVVTYTAAGLSTIQAYNAAGAQVETTQFNPDGSSTTLGTGSGLAFASANQAQTITATAGGDNFLFYAPWNAVPGSTITFGSETITGFQTASDSLSFSHLIFGNAAAVLAAATSDSAGDAVLNVGPTTTITLMGVSVQQLAAHQGLFHFF